ncbi:MAG: hypothetical protein EOP48_01975 [Sphingobacteriales bacterium]|nr:MAG: hypothetical protein EOP48_01975 [Sphingobacteriales bacterium]
MKVEYLDDMTDGGKFKNVTSENLIRLFDFDQIQTADLTTEIYQKLIINKAKLDLSNLAFIELVNCKLVLQVSSSDKGILRTEEPNTFTCDLTEETYKTAIEKMKAIDSGYNWLCDTSDDNIDFLYSSGGTW